MHEIDTVRALTIRQPWAWAIIAGHKLVENRSWPTRHRGRILVHSAARLDHPDCIEDFYRICRRLRITPPEIDRLPLGAVIGSVEVYDCAFIDDIPRRQRSPWHEGDYCWLLRNPQRLRKLMLRIGRLGLWPCELK